MCNNIIFRAKCERIFFIHSRDIFGYIRNRRQEKRKRKIPRCTEIKWKQQNEETRVKSVTFSPFTPHTRARIRTHIHMHRNYAQVYSGSTQKFYRYLYLKHDRYNNVIMVSKWLCRNKEHDGSRKSWAKYSPHFYLSF